MCKLISYAEYTDPTHIDGFVNRQDDITSSLEQEKDVRAVGKGLDNFDQPSIGSTAVLPRSLIRWPGVSGPGGVVESPPIAVYS
jgi:hypothetical protein